MSAYSPTLPRTAELRGTDRLLVLVGSTLTDLGRRRAVARARARDARHAAVAVSTAATAPDADLGTALDTASERNQDRAAMSRVSLLP